MTAEVVDEKVFAGKDCSYSEAVEWAFKKIGRNVSPKDAPSELAWKLHEISTRDEGYILDLFKEIIKRKSANEEEKTAGTWDGEREWDVLKNMREAMA